MTPATHTHTAGDSDAVGYDRRAVATRGGGSAGALGARLLRVRVTGPVAALNARAWESTLTLPGHRGSVANTGERARLRLIMIALRRATPIVCALEAQRAGMPCHVCARTAHSCQRSLCSLVRRGSTVVYTFNATVSHF